MSFSLVMIPFRNACAADPLVTEEAIDPHKKLSIRTFLCKAGFNPVNLDLSTGKWAQIGVSNIAREGGMAFKDSQGNYCLLFNCYNGEYENLAQLYHACPIKPQFFEIYSGSMKITKFKNLPRSVHRPNVYILRLDHSSI